MKIVIKEPFLSVFKTISEALDSKVYIVGGFVRDTLLGRETTDMDFATSVSPEVVHSKFPFLYYPKFGTTSFKIDTVKVTIATFREENGYSDHRHPLEVRFVDDYLLDYKRRDFTINCLYVDQNMNVLDPTRHGIVDLTSKRLCLIGDAKQRLEEDPLRILRAYRFSSELFFTFDDELKEAIEEKKDLIFSLSKGKVREELSKFDKENREKIVKELSLEPFMV